MRLINKKKMFKRHTCKECLGSFCYTKQNSINHFIFLILKHIKILQTLYMVILIIQHDS